MRAENTVGESGYSSMLFSLKKNLYRFSTKKNYNWISLPYVSGQYSQSSDPNKSLTNVSDIVRDIEGGVGPEKNQKIEKIAITTRHYIIKKIDLNITI